MAWFLLAIIASVLYATTNHIDKILLEKYFQSDGVGALLLFSAVIAAFAAPIFYFFDSSVFTLSYGNIFILIIVGLLNTAALWFYLVALAQEEASISIIYYQLVPAFAYIIGYFVLGEKLPAVSLIAIGIILLGTAVLSIDISARARFKFRTKTAIYMCLASLCWALSAVLFKLVALEENVWRSLFWNHVALSMVGVVIYFLSSTYRFQFTTAMRSNSRPILSLNLATATLYIAGNVIFSHAYVLAPIAMVLLVESFQPAFVLILGFLFTKFYPKVTSENLSATSVGQKVIAIVITGVGVWFVTLGDTGTE